MGESQRAMSQYFLDVIDYTGCYTGHCLSNIVGRSVSSSPLAAAFDVVTADLPFTGCFSITLKFWCDSILPLFVQLQLHAAIE